MTRAPGLFMDPAPLRARFFLQVRASIGGVCARLERAGGQKRRPHAAQRVGDCGAAACAGRRGKRHRTPSHRAHTIALAHAHSCVSRYRALGTSMVRICAPQGLEIAEPGRPSGSLFTGFATQRTLAIPSV